MLKINNLHASIDEKSILKGLNLEVKAGEVHAIMGPNGAGKSTLANIIAGKEDYEVTNGVIELNGEDISELAPEERAHNGVFLSFQYPSAVTGVKFSDFLRAAYNATHEEKLSVPKFRRSLKQHMSELQMDESFAISKVIDYLN